jgi:hypothetical protein
VNRNSHSKISVFLLGAALALACVLPASAATVQGQITNGTTGQPVQGQKVVLLMPRAGMQQVGQATAGPGGRFSLDAGQIDLTGFYLAQATYDGVDYHEPVQFDPMGRAAVIITVFDSSRTSPALKIPSARILIRAEGVKAHVQELFGIRNTSQPPRAYVSSSGTFRFHVPPAVGEPTVAVTGLMNMPLPQSPQAGRTPGDYSINYPIKPGLTVVMVAYDQDYTANQLSLDSSVNYPIEQTELFVFPPTLLVDSAVFKPEGVDQETNSRTYLAENLAANAAFSAQLSGEAAAADSGSQDAQSEGQIKTVPGSVTKAGVPLLLCFLLVLFWALGIRMAKEWPRWKAAQTGSPVQKKFQAKYDGVVRSIADLDKLFAEGKVPEKQYWKERLELKARAVALLKKGPEPKAESYAGRDTPR